MREIIAEEISKKVWDRGKVAKKIATFERIAKQGVSQRQIAEEISVPRSTLQHWIKRKENLEADKVVVEFFESPEGLVFLHQVVMAAQFVITQVGTGGIRLVCQFLELSGLFRYIASSYGAQQQVNVEMQKAIIEYSSQEKKRLSEGMKPKKITVCQDETFHEETCLVAIEPVSNFILVEKYDEKRDELSWNKAINKAVEGLKVEIIQSTSDEAKGILAHVNNGLGVHHSPDLFHIESELTKATSASLSAQKRKAESLYLEASEKVSQRVEQKESYKTQSGTNNLVYFEQGLLKAQEVKRQAQEELLKKQSNQKLAKDAIKAISDAYHPFTLESGLKRNPQDVEAALEQHFSNIEQIAQDAGLCAISSKRIEKARNLLPQMVATIAFFFQMVVNFVQEQSLSLELEEIIYQNLIPAYYLKEVSKKSKSAQQKKSLLDTSQNLMHLATSSALSQLTIEQQLHIHHLAKESSQLFQRSSSCVEGRNGQLSLLHHSLHRLTNSKLSALTTVHNFFTKRDDGSTAAQRFFGNKPKDLFLHLLDSIDLPSRPASKRSFLSSS